VIKQAPSPGRIAAMAAFALSCFGILLYLWSSFGGELPLAAKGYRFQADFPEATVLAENADVRVSGVNVGRVVDSRLAGDATRATIEIQSRYAPVPRDTRAILRQKTLLGETYVELTPGNPRAGTLDDGGRLPRGQVRPTVELDEILRRLDARTRRDLKRLVVGLAGAVERRGEDLNDAAGNLAPFAADSSELLATLDRQSGAVRRLVHDTGQVFGALGRRQGELSGLVRAGDRVLSTTARRDRELRETVRILPTTLAEMRPTFEEVEALTRESLPLVRDLRPAGRALGPALTDASALAPELRALFGDLDRVTRASRTALPATTRLVRAARPVFQMLSLTLPEAAPVVDYLGLMKQELVTMVANDAAATQGSEVAGDGRRLHYIRVVVPATPEGVVAAPRRFGTNRHNPYLAPRALDLLGSGLESIDCRNTGNLSPAGTEAPPCKLQDPIEFRGRRTAYPQVRRDPR
jgi:virulence factor Mce-like protein